MNLRLHTVRRPGFSAAISGFAILLAVGASAFAQPQEQPNVSADDLVKRAVETQLKDPGGYIHFMYRLHRQSPDRDETREVLETDDGTLARTIMTGGKPLSEDQEQAEEQRLNRYLADPSTWQQRRKRQKEDQDRSTKMLRELPNAFLYQYDGTDIGVNGDQLIRLSFKPNPNYDAPSRELRVYEGMQGKMWIDPAANRLVRLDAKLIRDVDFGWGILGRLYRGGSFEIEQRDIGDGRWDVVKTVLSFDGKELMFKGIHIHETETLSDFHRVPEKLTLADGIHMLEQYRPDQDTVAERRPAATSPGGGTPPKKF